MSIHPKFITVWNATLLARSTAGLPVGVPCRGKLTGSKKVDYEPGNFALDGSLEFAIKEAALDKFYLIAYKESSYSGAHWQKIQTVDFIAPVYSFEHF